MAFLRFTYVSQRRCHWAKPPLSRYVNVLAMTIWEWTLTCCMWECFAAPLGNSLLANELFSCNSHLLELICKIFFFKFLLFFLSFSFFFLLSLFQNLDIISIVICSFGRNTTFYSHYHTLHTIPISFQWKTKPLPDATHYHSSMKLRITETSLFIGFS